MMMVLARALTWLASEHGLAVLVTNYATAAAAGRAPALGQSWSFVPSVQLLLTDAGSPGRLWLRARARLPGRSRRPSAAPQTGP